MGPRVLVTRPEPDATITAPKLAEMGFTAVVLPLTETRPLFINITGTEVDAVAITSPNALRHAPPLLLRHLWEKPCFAVGPASATMARRAGFGHVVTGPGDAPGLAAEIVVRHPGDVLYLCGRVRLPGFEGALAVAGVNLRTIEIYDTIPIQYQPEKLSERLGGEPIDVALVYSLQAVRALSVLLEAPAAWTLGAARFLCLSPRVAEGFGTLDRDRLFWSHQPTEAALFRRLREEFP